MHASSSRCYYYSKKIACLHSFRVSDYNDAIVYLSSLRVFCIISGKRFVSDGL